ncbi:unnamed protein product [Paramecium octaurelia]|uniref:MORN repeat protein n=1 Tax=Paramecium octaurelia TaxID=43137 RepID=A0A8S1TG23_PAROT|nr:unnamed protein product [Paramecium octaurelia]
MEIQVLDIQVDKWDQNQERLIKTQIRITIKVDHYIEYSLDGVVLRNELIYDDSNYPEIATNLDQIKHLNWLGEYGCNKRKFGKWVVTWNSKVLKDVDGYYDNGLKQGLWNEPIRNYWSKAQVFERGVYYNNQKCGTWIFIQENKRIGGGQYNNQGQKDGKWVELSDSYYNLSQVTYKGEYKNGNKVGKWEYYLNSETNKLIGGGIYQEAVKGSIKSGKWIELSDSFSIGSQITQEGYYNNGKKVGGWNIIWNDNNINKKIGGGLYDCSIQVGRWIELIKDFGGGQGQSQIIYNGEYQNGRKVGRWNIMYQEYWEKYFVNVGGGLYDEQSSIKIGQWIEVSENFGSRKGQSFVNYIGEYKNSDRIGQWDIWYKYYVDGYKNKKIGGGLYDNRGSSKIGMWVEVCDGFEMNLQIIYKGEYQNGKKVGRWDTYYMPWGKEEFKKIGGGQYGEGGQIKIGKWIELIDGSVSSYECEYKDGKIINGSNLNIELNNIL